jgi:hypothetical protein
MSADMIAPLEKSRIGCGEREQARKSSAKDAEEKFEVAPKVVMFCWRTLSNGDGNDNSTVVVCRQFGTHRCL